MRWEDTAISSCTTDAIFRETGQKFAAAFAAIGLVKVPFTGQINWATVAKPATANTVQGYELWRFDDALQATAPVFIRVGYGGGYAASYFSLNLQIGTGHDGAGNLTGTVSAAGWTSPYTAQGAPYPFWVAGDAGRLLVSMFNTVSPYAVSLAVVERTAGPSGAPSAAGVTLLVAGNGNNSVTCSSTIRPGGVDTQTAVPYACTTMPAGTSGMVDNEVSVYPVRVWMARRETPPLHSLVCYFGADIAARTPFQARGWDGALRSYYPLGALLAGVGGSPNTGYVALRWD